MVTLANRLDLASLPPSVVAARMAAYGDVRCVRPHPSGGPGTALVEFFDARAAADAAADLLAGGGGLVDAPHSGGTMRHAASVGALPLAGGVGSGGMSHHHFPPFLGGPFRYVDQAGPDKVLAKMARLADAHGEKFAPPDILRQLARDGKTFHAPGA